MTQLLFFLIWGSFLNSVAYRITRNITLWGRSHCPHCAVTISWYDLVPLFSWIVLRGKCRVCGEAISPLYPLVAFVTVIALFLLFQQLPATYYFANFIFFSGLIVTIRTDFELMLISQYVTLALVPLALICSAFNLLPITPMESIIGAAGGYCIISGVRHIASWYYGREALGQGDADLLCYIGAFTGIVGAFNSLLIGSIAGALCGGIYLFTNGHGRNTPIPFGPFLAVGALYHVLFGLPLF